MSAKKADGAKKPESEDPTVKPTVEDPKPAEPKKDEKKVDTAKVDTISNKLVEEVKNGLDTPACTLATKLSALIAAENKGASSSETKALELTVAKLVVEGKNASKHGNFFPYSNDFKAALEDLKKSLGSFLDK